MKDPMGQRADKCEAGGGRDHNSLKLKGKEYG